MWRRRDLKKSGKAALRRNFAAAVAVCFLIAFLAGGYALSKPRLDLQSGVGGDVVQILTENAPVEAETGQKVYRGVLGGVVNLLTGRNGPVWQAAMSVRDFIMDNKIASFLLATLAFLVRSAYLIFVRNMLLVGEKRFFMESRLYTDTRVSRLVFVYREGKWKKPVWILFLRDLFLSLWWLTIVGGIIKEYAYRLVPYIVAENPDLPRQAAFALSKTMMKGNKWRAFVLDLSYFWWYVLSFLSLGLVGVFWLNPYRASVETELYMTLRAQAIAAKIPYSGEMNDVYLTARPDETVSPEGGKSHA